MIRDCQHPNARHQHGTPDGYNADGCRGACCKAAHAKKMRDRRRLKAYGRQTKDAYVSNVGALRRLQALAVVGWSAEEIGRRLGWTPEGLWRMPERQTMRKWRAEAIATIYEQLWNTPPPSGTWGQRIAVAKTKGRARQMRWAPPMSWDDDSIDNPTARPLGRAA